MLSGVEASCVMPFDSAQGDKCPLSVTKIILNV